MRAAETKNLDPFSRDGFLRLSTGKFLIFWPRFDSLSVDWWKIREASEGPQCGMAFICFRKGTLLKVLNEAIQKNHATR